MLLNVSELEESVIYKILTSTIIPRPIGWISTVDDKSINNLAPFSYFNLVSNYPPCVMFSTVKDGLKSKDTLKNVLINNEFVVNMVTKDVVEKMNITSKAVPSEIDEFELANLTPIPSSVVKPMRVQESKIQLECVKVHHYYIKDKNNVETACVIIGEVKVIHLDDSLIIDNLKIDVNNYQPISRLSGANYGEIGNIFSIKRN